MSVAAAPAYLGNDFSQASPGLRFGMYLKLWEGAAWSKSKDKPLDSAKKLYDNDTKTMKALAARQSALAAVIPADHLLRLDALATAPFTTGLGNEHPLENGFAFLNPYGLPYLPGSGVKGVLRQAARELASGDWGETHGWDDPAAIDALFGKEDSNDAQRGALAFWDVIPQIKGDSLMVEIMTPHQGHYYQQKKVAGSTSPHDSGQPIPISYLTVPPNSGFAFHVVCDLAFLRRLAPPLAENGQWRTLLTAAFEHAFQWLGFGAKTAVGYGAMRMDEQAAKARQERQEQRLREEELKHLKQEKEAAMDPIDRAMQEVLDQRSDKNQPELTALIGAVKKGEIWQGDEQIEVAKRLQVRMEKEKVWKEQPTGKKPEKDKDYQNTLLVKKWLGAHS